MSAGDAIPETRPVKRCDGCAFRPGTVANRDAFNQLRVKLCLFTSHPFLCHEGADPATGRLPDGRQHLCGGFADAMEAKLRRGDHQAERPEWQGRAARAMLRATDEVIDADHAGLAATPAIIARALGMACMAHAPTPADGADLLDELFNLTDRAASMRATGTPTLPAITEEARCE